MKIVIVGAGGVGGYFGGLLARSGQDVTFVARGEHLDAIRTGGLHVKSIHGDFHIEPAHVAREMTSLGPADLILVCVKDYQLASVIPGLQSIIDAQTTVMPLLNGVRAADLLVEHLGDDSVLGGLCKVIAFKSAPGIIQQLSPFRSITFGEWDGLETPRAKNIFNVLQAAGIETSLSDNIRKEMWTKFLFITAYSGVASVIRLPAGVLRACPETMTLMRTVMEEIETVARAMGVILDNDVVDRSMAFFAGFPDDATASMQRDVQDGRMFELEALTGSVVRYGKACGVPTPANIFIYAALKPQEQLASAK